MTMRRLLIVIGTLVAVFFAANPAYAARTVGPLNNYCEKNLGQSSQYRLDVNDFKVVWHDGGIRSIYVETAYFQESNSTYYNVGEVAWYIKSPSGTWQIYRFDSPPGIDPWGQLLLGNYKPKDDPTIGHYWFVRVYPGYAYTGAPYCDSQTILN